MHPLVESHHYHNKQKGNSVYDAIRSNRQIAAGADKSLIDDDDDERCRRIHHERRHADCERFPHDPHPEPERFSLEMDEVVSVGEKLQLPHKHDCLRNHGGQRAALYSPFEPEDEKRIEDKIDRNGHECCNHRFLGSPDGAQQRIQPHVKMGYRIPDEDDAHEILGIGQSGFACAEEQQYGVEENQRHDGKCNAEEDVQRNHVSQDDVSRFVVLLSHPDG